MPRGHPSGSSASYFAGRTGLFLLKDRKSPDEGQYEQDGKNAEKDLGYRGRSFRNSCKTKYRRNNCYNEKYY